MINFEEVKSLANEIESCSERVDTCSCSVNLPKIEYNSTLLIHQLNSLLDNALYEISCDKTHDDVFDRDAVALRKTIEFLKKHKNALEQFLKQEVLK